jgi:hypothetical protein
MHAFRVVDKKGNDAADASNSGADPEMEQIAALYGAKEIIRLVLNCDGLSNAIIAIDCKSLQK